MLEESLKEVKMIFLGTMTLKEAECSQGICNQGNQQWSYHQSKLCVQLPPLSLLAQNVGKSNP